MIAQTRSNHMLQLLAAVCLAALAYFGCRALATIQPNSHAVITHGAEAIQARNCLNNNGPSRAFQEKDGTVHLLCQGDNWYDVIIKQDGSWVEKTSFAPKNGQLNEILNWLRQKNVKAITDLAQFKGLKFPLY